MNAPLEGYNRRITMSELQNLVKMREEANRPILAPRRRTPIPTSRRNVRQLIQYFEANPILPLIGLFRLPEKLQRPLSTNPWDKN